MNRIDGMPRKRTTAVSKAAIRTSRKYPDKNVWYFCKGNNECFVIGGLSYYAFIKSGISNTLLDVEKRLYVNGRKVI